jgi:hypothetical protein
MNIGFDVRFLIDKDAWVLEPQGIYGYGLTIATVPVRYKDYALLFAAAPKVADEHRRMLEAIKRVLSDGMWAVDTERYLSALVAEIEGEGEKTP